MTKITGPWKEAILYVLGQTSNYHYEAIFSEQFMDLNQHKELELPEFIDKLCEEFMRYQRYTDGRCQIVPRQSQKEFLHRIITGKECFHFSEVALCDSTRDL